MTLRPLEAENAVAGALLIDPACLSAIRPVLKPEDMTMEVNRAIYRAALELSRSGEPVDPITIRDAARKAGVDLSGEYLMALMDQTPTAANAGQYARLVRDASVRRAISEAAKSAEIRCASSEDPQSILSDLRRSMEQIGQEGADRDLYTPDELILRFYEHRERVDSGTSKAHVPTGYRDLDMLLGGGLLCSGMYVLAARPGMGKSTLAINIADRVAARQVPVLFVSLEMDDEQITSKRIARECGISGNRLLMDKLSDSEYRSVHSAAARLRNLPVSINARPTATTDQIEDMAVRIHGLGLIVIDYLGKISPGDRGQKTSRYEYTTEISGEIKDLARRHRVPVLLLAQLNREVEKRADRTPQLSDLRDTGAVEQDADGVIFLSRPSYYGDESSRDRYAPEITTVCVAKNRHGDVGECELAFGLAMSKVSTPNNDPRAAYRKVLKNEE